MIKLKKAQVVAINELVEDEILLLIDKTVVACFISYCPYKIETGKTYDIELTLNLSEDYEAKKSSSTHVLAERTGDGFSYVLYGTLNNGTFQTFTLFSDEGISYDHPDLHDSFIKLTVERIDAAFKYKIDF
ncbi:MULTISPECIES: hypothetical protein [unclassified Pseudomonas]|uniref:hypothetical protein n=1 Tax=unclassified Pseudomonas TaxID=196821 RepID=UPI001F58A78B|nr:MULTISPECIES: hypothetical protein [unclassified Pseudomonas]